MIMQTLFLTLIYILYMLNPFLAFFLLSIMFIYILCNKYENFLEKILRCLIISLPVYGISVFGDNFNHIISFSYIFILIYTGYIFLYLIRCDVNKVKRFMLCALCFTIILTPSNLFFTNDVYIGILRIIQTDIVVLPVLLTYYAKEKIEIRKNISIDVEFLFNCVIKANVFCIFFQFIMYKCFEMNFGYIYIYINRIIYNGLCNAASVPGILIGVGIITNYYYIINKKFDFFKLIDITIFLLGIMINTSRTGIVGIIIVCLVITVRKIYYKLKNNNNLKNKILLISLFVVFCLITFAYVLLVSKTSRNELSSIFSLNGRMETYIYGIKKIFSSFFTFVFGNGLDVQIYKDGTIPHNIIIESFMEIGFIGVIFLIYMYWKVIKSIKNEVGRMLCLNILICCMLITGFLSIPMYTIIFIYSLLTDQVEKNKNVITKRILQYIPAYNVGGIETLMYNILSDGKNCYKYDLLVEVDLDESIKQKLNRSNINIIRINNFVNENPFLHFIQVRKIIKYNDYDIVHSHEIPTRIAVLYYAKKYNVERRILHSHSVKFERPSIIKNITARINIENANIYVACSEESSKIFKSRKCNVIYNGINPIKFEYNKKKANIIRKKYNISADTFVIIQIGRISKVKNFDFMLDVVNSLDIKYKFFIVGDGEQKSQILYKIKKYKLQNNVIMVGNVSNVEDYLSAANLYVMPSLFEGFAIGAVEAQANGIDVILSNFIPKLIKITNNVYIESLNKQRWKNLIVKLSQKDNYDRYSNVKIIAKSNFTIDKFKENIYKLYN